MKSIYIKSRSILHFLVKITQNQNNFEFMMILSHLFWWKEKCPIECIEKNDYKVITTPFLTKNRRFHVKKNVKSLMCVILCSNSWCLYRNILYALFEVWLEVICKVQQNIFWNFRKSNHSNVYNLMLNISVYLQSFQSEYIFE